MSKRRADVEVDSPSQADPDAEPTPADVEPEPVPTRIVEDLEKSLKAPSAVRTNPATGTVNVDDLEGVIDGLLQDRLSHFIADIERRFTQALEIERATATGGGRKVFTEDLNLPFHMIEGYTVTANSPGAGSIAWANVNIVYNGTNYAIAGGNTAFKYTWFDLSAPTALVSSDTQPVLATGDTLVFVNNAGVPTSVLEGNGIAPAIGPATVNTANIVAGAVGDTQIGGVTAAKVSGVLGTGNIPALDATKITTGVLGAGIIPNLDAAKITTGTFATTAIPALDASKITSGTLPDARLAGIATSKLVGTVADAQIAGVAASKVAGTLLASNIPALDASKVTTGILGAGIIPNLDAAKITTGTFAATAIPNLDAAKITTGSIPDARIAGVAASKLSGQVADSQIAGVAATKVSGTLAAANIPGLDTSKIITGTFGSGQIGAGAITPVKLNTLQHVLY